MKRNSKSSNTSRALWILSKLADGRRNLDTFATRAAAQKNERAVQFFKRG
jgi:hypothetical protein